MTEQRLTNRFGNTTPGLTELLKAHDYAKFVAHDVWNFAVEINTLRGLGLTETDLRWLVSMKFVQHARETTRLEDNGREFHPTGDLSFSKRTCFILTALGVSFARKMVDLQDTVIDENVLPSATHVRPLPAVRLPRWDRERHELWVNSIIVKQYKWPALNQETILAAFEEEAWTARIDDPLPPQLEQDPRRRLHDTIKCLNKNQRNYLIHFRGDGTGQGVVWEFVEAPSPGLP